MGTTKQQQQQHGSRKSSKEGGDEKRVFHTILRDMEEDDDMAIFSAAVTQFKGTELYKHAKKDAKEMQKMTLSQPKEYTINRRCSAMGSQKPRVKSGRFRAVRKPVTDAGKPN